MATAEKKKKNKSAAPQRKVRYGIVGLGHISQVAVLPAFAHAKKNSELKAFVSGDKEKLKQMGQRYGVEKLCGYDEYDALLKSGDIDAVYIALPNDMHRDYTVRAAQAGVHVLCEKPMAVTEKECELMIRAAEQGKAKLMIAYRLHFEEANLKAADLARSGKLGNVRFFSSNFSMQVNPGNVRLQDESTGGGTLYDIGVYCINAARYVFRSEPTEVVAFSATREGDARFADSEEMVSAVLRFPEDRLATFTCSFGAASVSAYQIIGTKGTLRADPAYSYVGEIKLNISSNDKKQKRAYAQRDQFAAEISYFSDCVLNDREPEPSGREGLADVRIISALYRSAKTKRPVKLESFEKTMRPTLRQEKQLPPVKREPKLVKVKAPSKK